MNLQETKTVPSVRMVSSQIPERKKTATQRSWETFLARRNMASLREFSVM